MQHVAPLPRSQPAVSLPFENPFFTREIRAQGRRSFTNLMSLALLQAVLGMVPLLLVEQVLMSRLPPDMLRVLALVCLALGQVMITASAGWKMGQRVFIEEHRQSTLESLQLVSMRPWKWLLLKLLFPLYGLLLVWAAALPGHAALVVRGHFLPRDLWPAELLAGSMGLVAFGAALFLPPNGVKLGLRLDQRRSLTDLLADLAQLALPYWAGMVVARLLWDWLLHFVTRFSGAFDPRPFYETSIRGDHALAILLAAFGIAALASAYGTADPAGRWAPALQRYGRLFGIATAYYLWVGYQWPRAGLRLPMPALHPIPVLGWLDGIRVQGLLLLLLLPIAGAVLRILSRGKKGGRPEDPAAVRQIASLSRRYENPVFVRDLRVALRGAGLWKRFLWVTAGVLAVICGIGWLSTSGWARGGTRILPDSLADFLTASAEAGMVIGIVTGIPLLICIGAASTHQWRAEERMRTLPQLFGTPLPTSTVVVGRWLAALLVGVVQAVPAVAIYAWCVWYGGHGNGFVTAVCIGLWLASLGLVLSAGMASTPQRALRLRDLGSAACLSVYVMVGEGFLLVYLLNHMEFVADVEALLRAFSLGVGLVNLFITAAIYLRGVATLTAERNRDMEQA